MGLTQQVARFVVDQQLDEVDETVRHLAKRSILDGLGLAIAGASSEGGHIIQSHVDDVGARGTCTVLGTELALAGRLAASMSPGSSSRGSPRRSRTDWGSRARTTDGAGAGLLTHQSHRPQRAAMRQWSE